MLGYILSAIGGYFVGVILTCILLAKKNLQTYQAISDKTENSFKSNVALAKVAYKSYVEENTYDDENDNMADVEKAENECDGENEVSQIETNKNLSE